MARFKPVIARAEDGTEIYYPSVTDGAAAVGVRPGAITASIVYGTRCRKLRWRYADD